jgi:hypothetical protein
MVRIMSLGRSRTVGGCSRELEDEVWEWEECGETGRAISC